MMQQFLLLKKEVLTVIESRDIDIESWNMIMIYQTNKNVDSNINSNSSTRNNDDLIGVGKKCLYIIHIL